MLAAIIGIFLIIVVVTAAIASIYYFYQKSQRELKNYERGLKMIPMMIHLPPVSSDLDGSSRDERDVTDELISQSQVMYNIISSTAQKGFKSKLYGQKHISFEIVSKNGLVYYYVVAPLVLQDVIKQAVAAAYPTARLEEVEEHTIFAEGVSMTGTIGGEFTLKKNFAYPIATYQETKRDASRAILNALSTAGKKDGIGIQILIRPASENWVKSSLSVTDKIKKDRASGKVANNFNGGNLVRDMAESLWKVPDQNENKPGSQVDTQLTSMEEQAISAIEDKTRYPGYETLIRVVVSSDTALKSQSLLKNVVAAFSLFDSPSNNGLLFVPTRNIDDLVTSYIFRFFPQNITSNVMNSVELATLFHLPDQKNIPTAQVKRQMSKQVDGPTDVMDSGFLIGYNDFRGVRKPIRLSDNDRRRHLYMIGQTGTGKSKFLENLAYQDMMDGKGFAFIDPHGDSAEVLMGAVPKERVEDVIYFNPSDMDDPIGLNMFEFNSPDQKDFLVQEGINMLYGLYDPGHTGIVGPRLEHIFRNCALLLMADPAGGTFIDIPKLLVDQEFMQSKLKYVTDQNVLDFWTKEWPASQKSSEAGELVSWVVSKFGPFLSNTNMRNIIGQAKSGFNLREIMDNRKILIVNLSKGKMGELNAKLLGIIFVMKFQAAAMARADMPENERQDFSLYVDEFQNFMTESFESILSEARKYRLSLILANQFMTQLTDTIREAIIGNVGTVIAGRIGITDAEILVKKFEPVFTTDDLTKMPNFQGVASVMINNTPSSPFSMSFTPPLAKSNEKLADAMKKLSATKYGRPRAVVEAEINQRLASPQSSQVAKSSLGSSRSVSSSGASAKSTGSSGSFLDDWLAKRKKVRSSVPAQTSKVSSSQNPSSTQIRRVNSSSSRQPSSSNLAAPPKQTYSYQQNTAPAVAGNNNSVNNNPAYGQRPVQNQAIPSASQPGSNVNYGSSQNYQSQNLNNNPQVQENPEGILRLR